MRAITPLKSEKTQQLSIKIPEELGERINSLKSRLKSQGYTIDVGRGAVNGIRRLLRTAEKEIGEVEAKAGAESKAETDNKPTSPTPPPPQKTTPRTTKTKS